MGGTLAGFVACGRGWVFDCGEYIDTLLGPERTRECFLLGKVTILLGFHADRTRLGGHGGGPVRVGCVV
jgi:hypothetical protein